MQLRRRSSPEAEAFSALLDSDEILLPAPVRTELLGGVGPAHRQALRRLLTALPVASPTDDTWKRMDQWAIQGSERGQSFGVGDLLIGAMAQEAGALVWSLTASRNRRAVFVHYSESKTAPGVATAIIELQYTI